MRGLTIMNHKLDRSTIYTACAFPRCGDAAWAPIQVPPASPVFILWSPLASLPNSYGGRFATGYRRCDQQEKCGTS